MTKVVFLDVDGVLNCNQKDYKKQEKSPLGYVGVGQKYLDKLKFLVDVSSAKIVLTSDWKDCFSDVHCLRESADEDGKYLVDRLASVGLRIEEKTVDTSKGNNHLSGRGEGIRRYLQGHPEVTEYVILDDIEFSDFTNELKNHFVKVNYGLEKWVVLKALNILKVDTINM